MGDAVKIPVYEACTDCTLVKRMHGVFANGARGLTFAILDDEGQRRNVETAF